MNNYTFNFSIIKIQTNFKKWYKNKDFSIVWNQFSIVVLKLICTFIMNNYSFNLI